jgi:methionine-rich copper-binding protein CopC
MGKLRWVVGLWMTWIATAALAHAHLQKAVPADGGTVHSAPTNVVLTFSEPARLTACWLTQGNDAKQKIEGLSTSAAKEITIAMPQLAAGSYVLSWRVMADDGHVMPGQIHFTIAPPGK